MTGFYQSRFAINPSQQKTLANVVDVVGLCREARLAGLDGTLRRLLAVTGLPNRMNEHKVDIYAPRYANSVSFAPLCRGLFHSNEIIKFSRRARLGTSISSQLV